LTRQLTFLIIYFLKLFFSVSGLSPFLGDDNNETLSYVTAAEYDFEDEAFNEISHEAKDFIEKLLHKPPR
jgi:myosin-light-chain kinase